MHWCISNGSDEDPQEHIKVERLVTHPMITKLILQYQANRFLLYLKSQQTWILHFMINS
jgi:hypothetical protein